jgi:hypothetical protein
MLMPEKEAEGRLCPVATTDDCFAYCNASRCMAWRWQSVDVVDDAFQAAQAQRVKDTGEQHMKAFKYVSEHRAEFGLPLVPTLGWCGIAGRPDEAPKVLR